MRAHLTELHHDEESSKQHAGRPRQPRLEECVHHVFEETTDDLQRERECVRVGTLGTFFESHERLLDLLRVALQLAQQKVQI